MYRQYENPRTLEDRLKDLQEQYQNLKDAGTDLDDLVDLAIDIHELEERVNFAWQDEESEEDYVRECIRTGEAHFEPDGSVGWL